MQSGKCIYNAYRFSIPQIAHQSIEGFLSNGFKSPKFDIFCYIYACQTHVTFNVMPLRPQRIVNVNHFSNTYATHISALSLRPPAPRDCATEKPVSHCDQKIPDLLTSLGSRKVSPLGPFSKIHSCWRSDRTFQDKMSHLPLSKLNVTYLIQLSHLIFYTSFRL